jgi:hypothetical protein
MRDSQGQHRAHTFLREHFSNQESFTQAELQAFTGWTKASTFDTYWDKQFSFLVTQVGSDHYRVTEAFRPYVKWEKFQRHVVTQKRHNSSEYISLSYDHLIIYEFFMPLTNETLLRETLDALFYKDTILRRLRSLEPRKLTERFPEFAGGGEEALRDGVANWAAGRVGGYSISHVIGRFRAGRLLKMCDAATEEEAGNKYLVDETTAIVRFIFHCGRPRETAPPLTSEYFSDFDVFGETRDVSGDAKVAEDAKRIRWLFGVLFVQSIVQVVNGEDEIWMVESGMRNRLHIWRVKGD